MPPMTANPALPANTALTNQQVPYHALLPPSQSYYYNALLITRYFADKEYAEEPCAAGYVCKAGVSVEKPVDGTLGKYYWPLGHLPMDG